MLYRGKKVKKWVGLNDDILVIFGWTIPLKDSLKQKILLLSRQRVTYKCFSEWNLSNRVLFFYLLSSCVVFQIFLGLHVTLSDLVFHFSKYKLLESFNKPDSLLFMISKSIPVWNPVNMQLSRPVVLSWFCFGGPRFTSDSIQYHEMYYTKDLSYKDKLSNINESINWFRIGCHLWSIFGLQPTS